MPTETETKNGDRDDESRVAIYVMRPPTDPYTDRVVGGGAVARRNVLLAGCSKRKKPDTTTNSRRTQQLNVYIQYPGEKTGVDCYGSHEYILRNFPQELEPGTNRVTHDKAIGDAICWRVTIPQHDRDSVLQRLDRMNINAYTLFRTEDALVKTYGERELRRMRDTI